MTENTAPSTRTRRTRTTDPAAAIADAALARGDLAGAINAPLTGKARPSASAAKAGEALAAQQAAKKAAAKKAPASKVVTRPEPRTEGPAADRVERLRLAKDEKKALDAWADANKGKGRPTTRPATPNLDALATAPTTGRKSKAAKVEVPAPTVGRGQVLVPLRNAAHGERIATLVPKGAGEVVDRWLVVEAKQGQAVLDAIVAAHADESAEFGRRMLMLASLWLRVAMPKLTDARTTKAPQVLTDLIAAGRTFEVRARADAQPEFVIDGGQALSPSAAAAELAGPAKKGKKA